MHDHFDHEFDRRFPGNVRDAIPRVPLDCVGPMHQVHVDGHEKLSSQALRLGSVTLPIYAYRDLWGGFVFLLIVLPNVRLASTCAHLYLDFVEERGGTFPSSHPQAFFTVALTAVPMTMVSDKGSETVQMMEFQKLLRCTAGAMFLVEYLILLAFSTLSGMMQHPKSLKTNFDHGFGCKASIIHQSRAFGHGCVRARVTTFATES